VGAFAKAAGYKWYNEISEKLREKGVQIAKQVDNVPRSVDFLKDLAHEEYQDILNLPRTNRPRDVQVVDQSFKDVT
jgi:hypothetical protein